MNVLYATTNAGKLAAMRQATCELGLELTDEQIDELSWKCTFFGKRAIGSVKVLELEDIKAIYHMAK